MPNKKINALDVKVAVATDLMLVGDPATGTAYKSTLATLPLVPTSRTITINGVAFDLSANRAWTLGTVTSLGLSMPSAFGVANSPITSSGTLAVTALGTASQYIRGDGVLATLPTGGSGGSSVSYYLNGGTAASVGTYFQMSTNAVVGANADFTRTGNGLISQFLTDVGDPNRLQIPAGNWNFEMFFSMSSNGGTPEFYVELLKYDGTTFTSIASSSAIPEVISGGTIIDLYLTSLAIPATTLLATDRLALRVYIVNNSGGRTATLHTQDSHLCQIITNFAGGLSALNGLTANTQYFATGTSGTDFGISSVSDTHTLNLPTASATNRGALSSADWTTFNNKVPTSRTLTINGTAYDLSADRSWTISGTNIYNTSGTLTSARTLTLGGFSLDFIGSTHTNRFTSAGRLLLGTTTESTFILDAVGTARISGGLTITTAFGLNLSAAASYLSFNSTTLLIGDAPSLIGGGTAGLGFRGAAQVFGDGSVGYHYMTANYALFSTQSAAVNLSTSIPASAVLEARSTTKGFLPPRGTNTQMLAIASPATGLMFYDTTNNKLNCYDGTTWQACW